MPITKDKIKIVNDLFKQMSEGLTRAEFIDSFKNVINQVLGVEKRLIGKIEQGLSDLKGSFSDLQARLESYIESKTTSAISDLNGKVGKALKDQEVGMNFIRDKVRRIKEGKDGHTPIKGKDYFDGTPGKPGKDGSPDTPEQILEKISGVLEIKDIKELKEQLDELKKLREGVRFGGGFSKIAMDIHILDPYTPTTVSTTEYTLTKAPNPEASLKVWRNGALQSLTEDYTLSGKTLTFLIAVAVGEIIKVEHRV